MKKRILLQQILTLIILLILGTKSYSQTCTIVDSISVNIGATPAFGVAWDGSGFWISGSPAGRIYKFNLAGQKVDTIKDPAKNVGDKSLGMVCVGNNLFTTCYTCDTLYEISLATKQVINRFVGMSLDERISIAYDGNNKLYFADGPDASGAFIFDIANGTFTPWGSPSPFAVGLIYFNQHVYGTFHSFAPSQSHITEFDTLTGAASNMQNWCVNDAAGGLGMTYDGQFIWQASYNAAKLYKIAFNPTGINEQAMQNDQVFFNNPVYDQLIIQPGNLKISDVEILDVTGKNIFSKSIEDGQSVNISILTTGIYLIKFYGKNHALISIKKMMKE